MNRSKIIYIVSPTGAAGGGMGRVKDYILESGRSASGDYRFEALVTRDHRGAAHSLMLLALAMLKIFWAAACGRLGFVHVNLGDKGSALRKGLVILAARAIGAKTLLHLHAAELTVLYARSSPLVRFLIRQPFHAATSVVVLGRLWRDWLCDDLGIAGGKIDVLYNGVPVTPPRRDFLAPTREPLTILFLGLLSERKGISDFIHALGALPADAPDWRGIVAGNGDVAGYAALGAGLGLADKLRFTGWVDQKDVRALLAGADMMVLPSYNEGLPLVILEALGSGTPVITTPIGAIPEVLEHDRSVLFVAPGDRTALTATVLQLLRDPALRQRLSDGGQTTFRARFTLNVFLDALFAIYRQRFGIDLAPEVPAQLRERRA